MARLGPHDMLLLGQLASLPSISWNQQQATLLTAHQASCSQFDIAMHWFPMSILCFDWQLNDMEKFLTSNQQFSVLTVDTTFKLGQFCHRDNLSALDA